jgi:hypothetical protein
MAADLPGQGFGVDDLAAGQVMAADMAGYGFLGGLEENLLDVGDRGERWAERAVEERPKARRRREVADERLQPAVEIALDDEQGVQERAFEDRDRSEVEGVYGVEGQAAGCGSGLAIGVEQRVQRLAPRRVELEDEGVDALPQDRPRISEWRASCRPRSAVCV